MSSESEITNKEKPILDLLNLSVGVAAANHRGYRPVVTGVSLSIRRGEMVALLGESGSGKSMTALALLGLLPPGCIRTGGQAFFDSEDLFDISEKRLRAIRGGRIAMIFQEPMTALNPVMTIGSQLSEVLEYHTVLTATDRRHRCIELLTEVGIPIAAERLSAYPHELSGGLRQRVMIAMALAGNPELLIADEPTTALDVTIQAQIMELLVTLQHKRGMAVLFITHNLALASQGADRCAVMYAGEIVECAPAADLFRQPLHPYSLLLQRAIPQGRKQDGALEVIAGAVPRDLARLSGCRFAERCPFSRPICHSAHPELRRLPGGRSVRCPVIDAVALPPHPTAAVSSYADSRQEIFSATELQVRYPLRHGQGILRAVDQVELHLRQGETLALVGESGCGKSTLGKMLIGLAPAYSGTVRLDGSVPMNLRDGAALRQLRHSIRMVFQDPFSSLDPRMAIGDSIAEGMEGTGAPPTESERRRRVETLLSEVGLSPEDYHRYPHQFSGGQRQRIGIARALAGAPRIIICDECTSALDVSVQAQILNLLSDLQIKTGIAYLFITHDLGVVGHIADRIAVMYLGQILEEGTAEEILRHPAHPYTVALMTAAPKFNQKRQEISYSRTAQEIPSAADSITGCPYASRCPKVTDDCRQRPVAWKNLNGSHRVRCISHSLNP